MANKKITDATTATSVAGTDKVFLNQGGDLKQVDLNSAVANSQAVQTLNSNLGTIHCSHIDQPDGSTQTFTFPYDESIYRRPFIYIHGSQTGGNSTLAIGILQSGLILYVNVIYGTASISFKNLTISSKSENSWATGFVIY